MTLPVSILCQSKPGLAFDPVTAPEEHTKDIKVTLQSVIHCDYIVSVAQKHEKLQ